ncbi:MAG: O-antigen polysaccharide polymerase Wzy [Oscillospiraceae bacterium]|nr:O-antigen polysaccharide polymerase Wzy [Oscillospiraceae bacterium]
MKNIKSKNIIYFLFYFLFCLSGMLTILFIKDIDTKINIMGVYVALHIAASVFALYKINKCFICYAIFFILFVYLFHTGQIILHTFFRDYDYYYDLYELYGAERYYDSVMYSLMIISGIVMGMLLTNVYKSKTLRIDIIDSFFKKDMFAYDTKKFKRIGYFIIITTLPVHLKILLQQLALVQAGNYLDSFRVDVTGITATYTEFLLVGITLVMLAYRENKFKLTLTYVIAVLYFGFNMVTGGRGRSVIKIIMFTIIYFKLGKISLGKLILFAVLGYMGIMCLAIIAYVRGNGLITPESISEGAGNIESPLLKMLEEFGGSLYTVILTKAQIPKYFPYKYGTTYLSALVSLFPTVNDFMREAYDWSLYYNEYAVTSMGGSVIAEIYANFGYWGVFPAMLMGYFINNISNKFDMFFTEQKYTKTVFFILFFTGAMWWIRDSVSTVIRTPLWGMMYLWILFKVYDRMFGKKRRKRIKEV